MNLSEFKKSAEVTSANTCNGWGFNGYFGKMYVLDQFRYRDAKWSYRHAPSTQYKGYFIGGKEVSKLEFESELVNLEYTPPKPKSKLVKGKLEVKSEVEQLKFNLN